MYHDDRSTCRAIVIIITPFVFLKMSLTCRDNFFVVKNVMTFKTCPLVRIGPMTRIPIEIQLSSFPKIAYNCFHLSLSRKYQLYLDLFPVIVYSFVFMLICPPGFVSMYKIRKNLNSKMRSGGQLTKSKKNNKQRVFKCLQ